LAVYQLDAVSQFNSVRKSDVHTFSYSRRLSQACLITLVDAEEIKHLEFSAERV